MKNVLIITHLFNQKEMIGSKRMSGLAKFIRKFGWEPTILTIKTPDQDLNDDNLDYNVIRTEYEAVGTKWKRKLGFNLNSDINKMSDSQKQGNSGFFNFNFLFRYWEEIFAFPDAEKYWFKEASRVGEDLLEIDSFNAVISSSPPVTSHLVARYLKKKYNIPWIADLRDLWSQNHHYSYSRYRLFFDTKLEKKIFNDADAITTVSEPLKNKLSLNHPTNKVHVITNGFEPEETYPSGLQTKFNITYTGTTYEKNNDIEPLFKALSELIEEKKITVDDISLDFYGNSSYGWIEDYVKSYNLERIISLNGLIPRKEAINKQRSSQLLLLLDWTNCNEKGVYTGKIFEYLAAKRPIISIGPCEGVVSELLKETEAGVHLFTANQIKNEIKSKFDEFKSNGNVKYLGKEKIIKKFSHEEMAKKFAVLLDKIIKK